MFPNVGIFGDFGNFERLKLIIKSFSNCFMDIAFKI